VQPTRYGTLPPQMAALCASNLAMFRLGVEAATRRNKEAAIHALMIDPLTASVCTPTQIRKMANEMFNAQKSYLPAFC